jgi:hypothetical protein
LTNILVTYNLKQSTFIRITGDSRCFKIKTFTKSNIFCQLDAQEGNFLEEWDYDFNLFKLQCRKKRSKSDNVLPEEKKLEKEFQEKVQNVKTELVLEIAEKHKEQIEENEEIKLTHKVQQIQTVSLNAIQKEKRLEDLLEKEEAAKEDEETRFLETQIEEEKKREECIGKVVHEREIENQMNVAKSRAADAIKHIQKQTQANIARQRQEIKIKIMEMRKRQARKKSALKNEIMHIRTTISNKLHKLNKNGSEDNCKNGITSLEIEKYCDTNFADNIVKHTDCKTPENFCYVCCENEFGDFHIAERDKCYAKCDLSISAA